MCKQIRPAVTEDISRIAEILIFTKRSAYRSIFQNDHVSFGEMQVLPLAETYLENPEKLNDYFKYYNELLVALSIENKVIEFKTKEEAMCWGLNIYKRIENIDVIKYTFTGNRTKKIMGYTKNKLGYKYNEVQICISRNDVIVKKEICS